MRGELFPETDLPRELMRQAHDHDWPGKGDSAPHPRYPL